MDKFLKNYHKCMRKTPGAMVRILQGIFDGTVPLGKPTEWRSWSRVMIRLEAAPILELRKLRMKK